LGTQVQRSNHKGQQFGKEEAAQDHKIGKDA
jgi:hypothetical protein